ncbi:MAG: hypothetical protein HC788_02360 [Sphingopyxis sp.]|nr:hypothetical protein [Sphingopyxis sp.]
MINPVSEQKAESLRERLSITMERIEVFPDPNEYHNWLEKISEFIGSQGEKSEFAIERYRGDLQFFIADRGEQYALIFLSNFTPQELVFFGEDWVIGISSYPECEGGEALEYAIRLYGAASILERSD